MIPDPSSRLAACFQKYPSTGWLLFYKWRYPAVQADIIEIALGTSKGTISSVFNVYCILLVSLHLWQFRKMGLSSCSAVHSKIGWMQKQLAWANVCTSLTEVNKFSSLIAGFIAGFLCMWTEHKSHFVGTWFSFGISSLVSNYVAYSFQLTLHSLWHPLLNCTCGESEVRFYSTLKLLCLVTWGILY